MTTHNYYPKLSRENADVCLKLFKKNGDLDSQKVDELTQDKFQQKEHMQDVVETIQHIVDIADKVNLIDQSRASKQEFHRLACVELHKGLKSLCEILRDPDFWRWFTFAEDGQIAHIVDLRWGKLSEGYGSASKHYYGIGRNNQGFMSTLWMRAENTFDEAHEDPYHLSDSILGDELWVSHFYRINFPGCKSMAKAFVSFVHENKLPMGDRGNVNDDGFRDLASELTNRFASTAYELMDQGEAYDFIANVWAEREIWKKRN